MNEGLFSPFEPLRVGRVPLPSLKGWPFPSRLAPKLAGELPLSAMSSRWAELAFFLPVLP